ALLPLAANYLKSDVFRRVIAAQAVADSRFQIPDSKSQISDSKFQNPNPQSSPGLWSELRFRLRRPLGILTGTIDKLLIRPADNGEGVDIEIIDFKTNRFPSSSKRRSSDGERAAISAKSVSALAVTSPAQGAQGFLDFEAIAAASAANELAV